MRHGGGDPPRMRSRQRRIDSADAADRNCHVVSLSDPEHRHAQSPRRCRCAPPPLAYAAVAARAGHQGRHRHVRLDRLRAAHARQGGRHLQEERPRRRRSRRSRRRTGTSRSRPATSSARRRPSRRGSCGTRTAWRPRRSSSSTRATAPTAWPCATTSRRSPTSRARRSRRRRPGTAPYFTLAWFLKKNGLSVKDVTVVNLEPGRRRAGVRRRPERRGDDLRAVPVDRARRAAGRQDHRDHARLSDDHGHVRLHAEVPRRQSEGGEGAGRQLLRGGRHDRARTRRRASRSWAPT